MGRYCYLGYGEQQQIEEDHNADQHKQQHPGHRALPQLEKLGTD
jgi:hypothetical protein